MNLWRRSRDATRCYRIPGLNTRRYGGFESMEAISRLTEPPQSFGELSENVMCESTNIFWICSYTETKGKGLISRA